MLNLQVFVSHKPKESCGPQYQEKRLNRLGQMSNLVVVIHSALPRYIYGYGFNNRRGGVAMYEPYYMTENPRSTITDREREILRAFHTTVRKVVAMGHKVIIVDPVPTTGWNPIRRLLLIEKYGLSRTFDDTVDYKILKDRLLQIIGNSDYFLIESMAENVASICLEDARVASVNVSVDKPGALTGARSVAVEISRIRKMS